MSVYDYYVLFGEDDLFCVIPRGDMIADLETLKKKDRVKFIWDSRELHGVVHHMDNNFDRAMKQAQKLSHALKETVRKEDSFDASQPRKSAVRFLNGLRKKKGPFSDNDDDDDDESVSFKKPKKSKRARKVKDLDVREQRKEAEGLNLLAQSNVGTDVRDNWDSQSTNSNEASDGSDSDDSLKGGLSQKKIAEKYNRMKERLKMLEGKHMELRENKQVDQSQSINPNESSQWRFGSDYNPRSRATTTVHVIPDGPRSFDSESAKSSSRPTNSAYGPLSTMSPKFHGQMLQFPEASDDAVELHGPPDTNGANTIATGVYCCRDVYQIAESGNSATVCARRLLSGVFTRNALTECCLTGLPPRGKGKAAYSDKENLRPYLCPKAVRAILNQSLLWQKTKYLRPRKDVSQIRAAMSIRICELRQSFSD